jgi:hypothetical protein
MRKLILIASLLSCVTLMAQDKVVPESRFHIGMGLGYGSKINHGLAQLNLSYNIARVHVTYAQTMFMTNNAPAFFQGRIGYQIGNRLALVPYIGYSYRLYNIERSDYGGSVTSGAELQIALAPLRDGNPTLYFNADRTHGYNLFVVGIKGTL